MLVVVTGLPGVGKSAVAGGLARRLHGCWLSIDVIENAMLGAGVQRGWTAGVAAYEVAGALAVENLDAGLPVVVDAVSDSENARETWRRAASNSRSSMSIIEVRLADESEHKRRLQDRTRSLSHVTEPSWDDVRYRSEQYQPWSEKRLVIDGACALEHLVEAAYDYVLRTG